ncbi:MAG: TrkH family potassium uptake protein [Bacteroidales bacterium]|jgi:trk system potassium uptake protein TrkH|nr:TrkH family potassium uptake protein [Bacteroidales bacterium]
MINKKIIFQVMGLLLLIEGFFLGISSLVSLFYGQYDFSALITTSLICFSTGITLWLFTKNADKNIGKREGYIIVSLVWVIFSLFGALPFILSGAIPSFTDAFFETISGFTTTGASILNDIEALPYGLLFWRSLTQWLGGMGIIVLSIAILPMFGIGGMQLFIAEVPGPTPDKLHPRIKETAKRLWGIYVLFTLAEVILLKIGGMNWFDAVNHSFTTMATGGYSTKQASIGDPGFSSPFIHYVIIVFMFLAGTNFTLSYFALHLKFGKVFKNEEFRYYIGFIIIFALVITVALWYFEGYNPEKSFRDSLFQVVSIITTTGFVTADYMLWKPFVIIMIFALMFFGGSAGSTGGSIKIVRITLLLKNSYQELKRIIHPNAIIPVRINGKSVPPQIISNILAFVVFYMLISIVSSIVMAALGYDVETSLGAVAATLGNIGPGIGRVGPIENYAHIPYFGKWFLSFLMLIGRLELFTVIVLFSPAFWKK